MSNCTLDFSNIDETQTITILVIFNFLLFFNCWHLADNNIMIVIDACMSKQYTLSCKLKYMYCCMFVCLMYCSFRTKIMSYDILSIKVSR